MSASTVRGTIAGMGQRANPAFAVGVVAVALAALAYATTMASIQHHTYVHVMAGVLWTGTDLFIGVILGPVIGGLDEEASAAVFERLTPKTAFFLPSMAFLTIATGIPLALRLGVFPNAGPWLALFTLFNVVPILLLLGWRLNAFDDWRWQVPFAVGTVGSLVWVGLTIGTFQMIEPALAVALVLVTLLSVQGFGFLMPGEIRIYKQMVSPAPDASVISAIGQQNAKLGGLQGLVQLVLIADMVYLRYGGF
ncbi:hypothetical protein EGH22_17600 [Halomicroarcula sp. F28]|uniref:Uncharacterized protein n=2 Tax=Haloarcula salinisoli TaxID=2487746 RepID=A0A8J7YKE4_9EURY|nr:hypothetical protein [Halomicroarcula salinisoli]MBX0288148.1 hypothetical protein [Halomicroarcula salinisoli]MBX0305298.1 hypothetical protein [Halomicroarcula salinisoli]